MEVHQAQRIQQALPILLEETDCSTKLLAYLIQESALSSQDVEEILSKATSTEQAYVLYEILATRQNGYAKLIDSLRKTNQGDIVYIIETGKIPENFKHGKRLKKLLAIKNPLYFDVKPPSTLFTGRNIELKKLHELINKEDDKSVVNSGMIAIHGLGGIGKTQLCRKYIAEYKDSFDDVIWINAESEMSLSEGFTRLASNKLNIKLKTSDNNDKDISSIVSDVYSHFENQRVLFVFDNVEKGDYLAKFLPVSKIYADGTSPPKLVMTSRDSQWEIGIKVLKLDELCQEDATMLIKQGVGSKNEQQKSLVIALAKRLQCFPLALVQAISFIKEQQEWEPEYGIEKYLEAFDTSQVEMLDNKDSPFCSQLTNDYSLTTFTTWTITTNKISSIPEIGIIAINILQYMAYLDPETVGTDLIFSIVNQTDRIDLKTFRKAVSLLLKYSMINGYDSNTAFKIHRLVQEVTRLNMAQKQEEEYVLENLLNFFEIIIGSKTAQHASKVFVYAVMHIKLLEKVVKLSNKFTESISSQLTKSLQEYRDIMKLHVLHLKKSIPKENHVECMKFEEMLFTQCFNSKTDTRQLELQISNSPSVHLQLKIQEGVYNNQSGNYNQATKILTTTLDKAITLFGMDHFITINNLIHLFESLMQLNRWEDAQNIFEPILESLTQSLGKTNFTVLKLRPVLAKCYAQTDIAKTLVYMQDFLDLLSQPRQTLDAYKMYQNELTWFLIESGNPEKALRRLDKNWETIPKTIDQNEFDAIWYLRGQANLLRMVGKYTEALALHNEVYEKHNDQLGEHVRTWSAERDVGIDLYYLTKYEESLKLFCKVLRNMESVGGFQCNYDQTYLSKLWVADTYFELKNYKNALEMYKDLADMENPMIYCHIKTLNVKEKIVETEKCIENAFLYQRNLRVCILVLICSILLAFLNKLVWS